MKVGKLQDDSLHMKFLVSLNTYINVVRDCQNNFIVSLPIAEAMLQEFNYSYEEIDFCPYINPDDGE